MEWALAASQPMWRLTVGPGDDLEVDEHRSRASLDAWLVEPIGADAVAQRNLVAYLNG